jgi:hypothetical protein
MKANQVKEMLSLAGIHADVVSVKNGVYTAKRSYFYGGGKALDALRDGVSKMSNLTMTDSGDHWHAFVGSAKPGSAKDSYVWVSFTINQ